MIYGVSRVKCYMYERRPYDGQLDAAEWPAEWFNISIPAQVKYHNDTLQYSSSACIFVDSSNINRRYCLRLVKLIDDTQC